LKKYAIRIQNNFALYLRRKDSNLRIVGSKPTALPLGDA
jgi:hypothetical protein